MSSMDSYIPPSSPPGSPDDTSHDEWDDGSSLPRRKAAMFLIILGFVQLLLFACCLGGTTMVAFVPLNQLQQPGQSQISSEQMMEFEQTQQLVRPAFPLLMVTIMLFTFVPAVAYLVLQHFVRIGRVGAILAAMFAVIAQAIVFGVLLLMGLAFAAVQADPVSVTFQMLTLGSIVALLLVTARWLWRAYHQMPVGGDPWNEGEA